MPLTVLSFAAKFFGPRTTGNDLRGAARGWNRLESAAMKGLLERLQAWSETRAKEPALIHRAEAEREERRLDYRLLDAWTARVASRLRLAGVQRGDRVLVSSRCEVQFLVGLLGCLRAGVIAVPSLTLSNERSLNRMQAHGGDAGTIALLGDSWTMARRSRFPGPQAAWLQGLEWIDVEQARADDAPPAERPGDAGAVDPAAVAYLQYTSGSTSRPKGVRVTHGNLAAQLAVLEETLSHAPGEVVCNWMPLHHDFGLILSLQALYSGGTAVLMPSVAAAQRPLSWLQAVSGYGAVTSAAPNFMFHRCVERIRPEERAGLDLSALRSMMNGAEPVHPECVRAFNDAFAASGFRPASWRVIYGLAEATLAVTLGVKGSGCRFARFQPDALRDLRVEPDPHGFELASCGTPVFDGSVAVVDPETRRPCEPGRVGEVWVAGPSVADGYWKAPGQSDQAADGFGARVVGPPDDVPYLRTGDLGLLWDGELYIAGRLKDLVIVRGENHYPQDIEATVCRAHPALEPNGAAVFAVDGVDGEIVTVVAELRREGFRRLDPVRVFSAVRRAVTEGHGLDPAHIVLIRPGTLPRTSSGKVQRRGCRQAWRAEELAVVAAWAADREGQTIDGPAAAAASGNEPAPAVSLEQELLGLCRDLLAPEHVDSHTNLFEAGADSLKVADLILAIEKHWHTTLDLADLAEHPTPAALAVVLGRRISQSPGRLPAVSAADLLVGDSPAHPPLSTETLQARLSPYVTAWRGARAHPASLITGLHTEGTRVPLFWVFQGNEEWSALGNSFGPDQPLYGMRSGHLVMPYTDANVQTLATAYRRELQALWPNGPYLIGGNCQGGVIALAIAQQLWRLQQPVALLALMEWAFGPQPYPGRVALLWGQESEKNPYRRNVDPAVLAGRIYFAHTIDLIAGTHGQFFIPEHVGNLSHVLLRRMDDALAEAPAFLPCQAKHTRLRIVQAPTTVEAGKEFRVVVEVSNVSPCSWSRTESSGLWLAGCWKDDEHTAVEACGRLAGLPDVRAGDACTVSVELRAPQGGGPRQLELDLFEEGVGSLSQASGGPAVLRVTVR